MGDPCYRVRKWAEFQHYKTPSPVWIKLHRKLLDDHDFHSLEPASRALLVMLWLIAAESADGTIPDHKTIAWRLRMKERDIDVQIQYLTHFLEPLYTNPRAGLESEEKRREDNNAPTEASVDAVVFDGKFMKVTARVHTELVSVYDETLCLEEYKKADLWMFNNPNKRRKRIGQFMANWMENAVKRVRGNAPLQPEFPKMRN